jgi:hypothetical protein
MGVADGSGGVFHCAADRYLGPFSTNYEVGPVLVASKIPRVSWGRRDVYGDPRV